MLFLTLWKWDDSSNPVRVQAFLQGILQPPQHGCFLSSMSLSRQALETCAASEAGLRHMSSCKPQVSRKVHLHSLSWLDHPLLQLQHVADFGGNSMRRAPDVPNAEHHWLREMLSICLEVNNAPTHRVERTSQGLPHALGSLCRAVAPVASEKDESQTKLLLSFCPSPVASAA